MARMGQRKAGWCAGLREVTAREGTEKKCHNEGWHASPPRAWPGM